MTLFFTLCSNNYLSQAKTLGDSFKRCYPQGRFVIGLVDKLHESIDYNLFSEFEILKAEDISIPNLPELAAKYNIVELNTAVKPYYLTHFFEIEKASKVIYLDPDIEIFSPLVELEEKLDETNIVLTPQNLVPIEDGYAPSDTTLLATGIFNLGFIGLSDYNTIKDFIEWWKDRVSRFGHNNVSESQFFDQLWINLVPVFFDNYYILKHPGYNMSASNLHERSLSFDKDGKVVVNNKYPLRFYHYTGYKFSNPDLICAYSYRYTFDNRPDIKGIFSTYHERLGKNMFPDLNKIPPYYKPLQKTTTQTKVQAPLKVRVKNALKVLIGR